MPPSSIGGGFLMAIVLGNAYKDQLLQAVLDALPFASDDLVVGLFTNNITPTGATLKAAFTPPTWTGYAAQSWDFMSAFLNADNRAEADGDVVVWYAPSMTGLPATIYGYYVFVNDGSTTIVYSERNEDGPVTLTSPGQVYAVFMKIFLDTLGFAV